jgi:hypothetical protein
LAFLLLLGHALRAEELPHFTPRELVVQATTVVRATPLQPWAPRRFRVTEVLKGDGQRVGESVTLDDMAPHDWQVYEENLPPGHKPRQRRVVEALLFLGPRPRLRPVLSGLRFLADDGAVFVPRQLRNPGGYFMAVRRDVDWDALGAKVRADCAAVRALAERRSLAVPAVRNRALLDWVRQHRRDFGGADGWGDLEQDVFAWVLAGGRPADAWEAARLYAELHDGAAVPLRSPAFASRPGRALLLGMGVDKDALEGDRVRALTLLADRQTLWPEPSAQRPGRVEELATSEQADLIDCLVALLKEPGEGLRAAAARALLSASDPADGARSHRRIKRALPSLTAAYRAEAPGPARDDLAEAVCVLGGPDHWREVSGNAKGLRGRLRDFGRHEARAFFWLDVHTGGLAVFECPQLRLEWVAKDGRVVETREQALPAANLPRPWNEGWEGTPYLFVEFPVAALSEGTWRVSVTGTAGKGGDKVRWRAEPRMLLIPAPPPPGAPNPPW